ncbi:hypothetical protein ACROYT_G014193 [Oculina patagonica]
MPPEPTSKALPCLWLRPYSGPSLPMGGPTSPQVRAERDFSQFQPSKETTSLLNSRLVSKPGKWCIQQWYPDEGGKKTNKQRTNKGMADISIQHAHPLITLTDALTDALVELNEDCEETDCSDDFSHGDDDLECRQKGKNQEKTRHSTPSLDELLEKLSSSQDDFARQ